MNEAAAPPTRPAAVSHPLQRLAAAGAGGLLFVDAALRTHGVVGLSTFGRPPELSTLWATLALVSAVLLLSRSDRLTLARRLTLLLLAASLFGGQAVPAAPEAHLVLLGVTLWVAAPTLRLGKRQLAVAGALMLALPGALASDHPQASLVWAQALLPQAALVFLLPALFAGGHARRAALMLVAATGVLCATSLATYLTLSQGLGLPLDALFATRLRPVGLHPNLAVPQLVTSLVVGCALLWDPNERRRTWVLVLQMAIVGALWAVQSKTGALVALAGVGLLVARRLPWRPARWVHPLACAGVVLVLLVPATGLSEARITDRSADMTTKAVSFRAAMWSLGRRTALGAPWHGFGPGTRYHQASFAEPSRYDGLAQDDHPHNVVLGVAGALGWPGVVGLGLLLAVSLRPGRRRTLVSDAASAALLASWAANGIDLGGAVLTVYPSLALLGLGLHAAAEAPPRRPELRRPLANGLVTAGGLVLVALGLTGWLGLRPLEGVDGRLPPAGAGSVLSPEASLHEVELREALGQAALLRPLDPAVPLMRARLEASLGDTAAQLEAVRAARALAPSVPELVHREALLLARTAPDDPRVLELLDESVRLDPLGPQAWRRQVDLAVIHGGHGHEDEAFDHLLTALMLNPGAIAEVGFRPADETVVLGWEGSPTTRVPLTRVLVELGRRRAARAESDPASAVRLRMREVEIFIALGMLDRADEASRRLLQDERIYLGVRLAATAGMRGDWDTAVRHYAELPGAFQLETSVSNLMARAQASEVDEEAFDAVVERVLSNLPDLTFEAGTLRNYLEARRRFAERLLDADAAVRFADQLAFASR